LFYCPGSSASDNPFILLPCRYSVTIKEFLYAARSIGFSVMGGFAKSLKGSLMPASWFFQKCNWADRISCGLYSEAPGKQGWKVSPAHFPGLMGTTACIH